MSGNYVLNEADIRDDPEYPAPDRGGMSSA